MINSGFQNGINLLDMEEMLTSAFYIIAIAPSERTLFLPRVIGRYCKMEGHSCRNITQFPHILFSDMARRVSSSPP